jgi:iron complex transport system permease protein
VLARLLVRIVPGSAGTLLLPASGLLGALVVILADVLLRLLIGAEGPSPFRRAWRRPCSDLSCSW